MIVAELIKLKNLIDFFRWEDDKLIVGVYNCDLSQFLYILFNNLSLIGEDGIKCIIRNRWTTILSFNDVLEKFGLTKEEIKELFQEKPRTAQKS